MRRLLATLIVGLAARLLPAPSRGWGRAMAAEVRAIDGDGAALGFAFGCLGSALREAVHHPSDPTPAEEEAMIDFEVPRPRRLAILCAVSATGLGLAWMGLAGAPPRYLAVNATALLLGLLAVAVLGRAGDVGKGIVNLMLAILLLLTALTGVSAEGVTRWVPVGGILLQPALLLLPILALRFGRTRDPVSTLAILIAALALALQPDRAMAGALAATLAVLAAFRPQRNVLIALAAAWAGFAATLLRPDPSPAMPFVDQIFFSAFTVHMLAGLAVAAGAVLMLVPALAGLVGGGECRVAHAAFGAMWGVVILAALLGNYPTPLVGYGGSAILGYLVSLLGLPPRVEKRREAGADRVVPAEAGTHEFGGSGRSSVAIA